ARRIASVDLWRPLFRRGRVPGLFFGPARRPACPGSGIGAGVPGRPFPPRLRRGVRGPGELRAADAGTRQSAADDWRRPSPRAADLTALLPGSLPRTVRGERVEKDNVTKPTRKPAPV